MGYILPDNENTVIGIIWAAFPASIE